MAYIAMASGLPCVVPSFDSMHCPSAKSWELLQ